jgi:hypothetical protein
MRLIRDRSLSVDLDEFLARPLFARFATCSPDGPRESPVWFLWKEGAIWIIGSLVGESFPARIRDEPRCAIGIVDFDQHNLTVRHVGFRGHAQLLPFEPGRARRLLARYLGRDEQGWDIRFRKTLNDPDNSCSATASILRSSATWTACIRGACSARDS